MTQAMLPVARAAAPGLKWQGRTCFDSPPAIQGPEDGLAATGPVMAELRAAVRAGARGVILGCFDDTALDMAAHEAPCPVIGIGQAAFHMCALRSWRFSVVTTLPVSVPVIEDNLHRYGLAGRVGRVRASDVPVLALEEDPQGAIVQIRAQAQAAIDEDRIDAIVLGCAGMVNVVTALRADLSVPVIDPVEAAAGALSWLI